MSEPAGRFGTLGGELARFLVVGLGALVVDFSVYFGLLWLYPALAPSPAKTAAFIAGASWSFVMNRIFVFRASGGSAVRQAAPFIVLYALTLLLNTSTNALALTLGAARPLAWFVATAASTVANFLGMKLVVFRRKPTP